MLLAWLSSLAWGDAAHAGGAATGQCLPARELDVAAEDLGEGGGLVGAHLRVVLGDVVDRAVVLGEGEALAVGLDGGLVAGVRQRIGELLEPARRGPRR
jgi:hypothetical protein